MKNSSLGQDALKLTISKVIIMCISLVSSMLLSRFRTLEEYGTYSQLLLVINLITAILMLGFPKSINYFLARADSDKERQRFVSVYYTYNTLLGVAVGVVLVCAVPLIVRYFENDLIKNFIYFLAIFPWTKIIMASIENILIVYKKSSMIMLYRIANSICLLSIILIVQILNWTFSAYMILYVVVEAVFTFCVYFIVRKISGRLNFQFDTSLVKQILVFSIPLGLASVVGTLNIELDKLMIGNFFDTEHMAIYTNASKEMPVVIIATSLTAVLLPRLARLLKDEENKKAVKLWGNVTLLSYTLICFLATGLFVYSPDVMTFLYSEKYLPGVSVFRVYNVVLLLRCTYFGMILSSKGKTKFIFYSSLISLGLNVVLNYLLFNLIGFIGPAVATFISQIIINLFQLIFTARSVNTKFSRIFPWRSLGLVTLINFLFGAAFYWIKGVIHLDLVIGSLYESIFLSIIWGVLYITVFYKRMKAQWLELNRGE